MGLTEVKLPHSERFGKRQSIEIIAMDAMRNGPAPGLTE
jgi:hypothetical protein